MNFAKQPNCGAQSSQSSASGDEPSCLALAEYCTATMTEAELETYADSLIDLAVEMAGTDIAQDLTFVADVLGN